MKLKTLEFNSMNNPIRRLIQDKYELKILSQISSIKNIDNALEIGCGSGYGTHLIKSTFSRIK